MPGKKKGGAGKGRKKKKKKKLSGPAFEKENAMAKMPAFLKLYSANCVGSFPSSRIVRECRDALEDRKALTTVSNEVATEKCV